MATAKTPAKVLTELNRQFNQEFSAAYGYLAMSSWCMLRNLKGFGSFFAKQSEEERKHAEKIMQHILNRQESLEFTAIISRKQDFKSLPEVAERAQAMEQANTRGINAVYEAALAAKDYPAQVLMHWFINEQVEEEKNEMLFHRGESRLILPDIEEFNAY